MSRPSVPTIVPDCVPQNHDSMSYLFDSRSAVTLNRYQRALTGAASLIPFDIEEIGEVLLLASHLLEVAVSPLLDGFM